ncbi:MAG: phosphotransferase [Maribacter sp.]|nr:phosphotransferase [Maribacter sp.]
MTYFDLNSSTVLLWEYLASINFLWPKEDILHIEKPGEGNMNVVLRIRTSERSFILKQSRPYVQKYPQVSAPLDRIAVEYQFYKTIDNEMLVPHLPEVLYYDPKEYVLLMKDLGHCEDMTKIYVERNMADTELENLVSLLGCLHQTRPPKNFPPNRAMRKLNYQHIFQLPFALDNGFELDDVQPGLQTLAMPFKSDDTLKEIIGQVGNAYLSAGKTLIHGDYYPGSWMTKSKKMYILDPEFSFLGFAEFDLGVMAAHMVMATMDRSYMSRILALYKEPFDEKLTSQVAGIEIMRRLIGLAQLPMQRTLEEKELLLRMAHNMTVQ